MLNRLHAAIDAAGIPHAGVWRDGDIVGVNFKESATLAQRADAQSIVNSFDWLQSAHDAWLSEQEPEKSDFKAKVAAALAGNDAFLALVVPTIADITAQVRALTRQSNSIVKALRRLV